MKYLVTGGAGFIGSNLVEELLKRGEKVRVLDNFSTGKRENLKEFEKDIELIEGDIRSYHIVKQAVKGIDIVLHQAALPSVPRSIHDPITTNEVNVGGTLNMLDASKEAGVKRFVFASSSSIYGDTPNPQPLIPNSSAVIGLGYVGLPLALEFCSKGIPVIGFDVDKTKVDIINKQKKSYIKHIDSGRIKQAVSKKLLRATTDFSKLKNCDAIIICVPTPLNKNREPDISYVIESAKIIAKYLRKGQLISLESTTYPGTTEEDLLPIFEETGLKVGKDFYLCFSPEREDPNNKKFSTATIPKVIGGVTEKCTQKGVELYSKIINKVVPVSSTKAAEATKLLENIYRSINIALVNELKMVFDKMGIDIWEVIEAASTKPFGFTPFYPGPGLGGHCIPIDPFYLTWKAREFDISTKFIELAGEINTFMPFYVLEKAMQVLNRHNICMKGAKILILGLAYKKDIDDLRESPALKLIELLQDDGAIVDYNDDYVTEIPVLRKYKFNKKSVKITPQNLKKYDLILVATDHSYYDLPLILKHSSLILDTRNLFKNIKTPKLFKS